MFLSVEARTPGPAYAMPETSGSWCTAAERVAYAEQTMRCSFLAAKLVKGV